MVRIEVTAKELLVFVDVISRSEKTATRKEQNIDLSDLLEDKSK
jgi:hypothetical protein